MSNGRLEARETRTRTRRKERDTRARRTRAYRVERQRVLCPYVFKLTSGNFHRCTGTPSCTRDTPLTRSSCARLVERNLCTLRAIMVSPRPVLAWSGTRREQRLGPGPVAFSMPSILISKYSGEAFAAPFMKFIVTLGLPTKMIAMINCCFLICYR